MHRTMNIKLTKCCSYTVVHGTQGIFYHYAHKHIKSSISICSYTFYNYCYHIHIDTCINSLLMRNVVCATKFNNDLLFLTCE